MPNVKIGEDTLTNVSVVKLTDADDTSKFVEFCSSGRATFEITAPAGSTIDILQNSIIIKSYTLGASETFCSLKVDVSSTLYTVRATLDSKTDEQEVLANAANIYTITLKFKLWLYKDGNEYTSITGGWGLGIPVSGWDYGTVTKNDKTIYVEAAVQQESKSVQAVLTTNNAIDVTGYTKIYFIINNQSQTEYSGGGTFLSNSKSRADATTIKSLPTLTTFPAIISMDIPTNVGNKYILLMTYSTKKYYIGSATISGIYLE